MKVLVCGGRKFADKKRLFEVLDNLRPKVIVQGGCPTGADALAKFYAEDHGLDSVTFYARWDLYGKAAGPIRNGEMLAKTQPDLVVAFPGGKGTQDMVSKARTAKVRVMLIDSPIDGDDES
jgi:hypothetical protein